MKPNKIEVNILVRFSQTRYYSERPDTRAKPVEIILTPQVARDLRKQLETIVV